MVHAAETAIIIRTAVVAAVAVVPVLIGSRIFSCSGTAGTSSSTLRTAALLLMIAAFGMTVITAATVVVRVRVRARVMVVIQSSCCAPITRTHGVLRQWRRGTWVCMA